MASALKQSDYRTYIANVEAFTEASWSSWETDDLRPYVEIALELFGPERMMFGSDHPVCLLASSYQRVLQSFQEILHDLPAQDRERIFATNATEFYRLN